MLGGDDSMNPFCINSGCGAHQVVDYVLFNHLSQLDIIETLRQQSKQRITADMGPPTVITSFKAPMSKPHDRPGYPVDVRTDKEDPNLITTIDLVPGGELGREASGKEQGDPGCRVKACQTQDGLGP